jgi:hypothetical protein
MSEMTQVHNHETQSYNTHFNIILLQRYFNIALKLFSEFRTQDITKQESYWIPSVF